MRHLISICAVAGLASHALSQIVTNGDFETGVIAPWTFTADPNAEPLMVATVASLQGSQMFRVNPGNNSGGAGGSAGGNLEQQVTLQSGTEYTISGNLYIEKPAAGSNSNGGTITVSINGAQMHTWTVGSITGPLVMSSPFSLQYTATSSGPQPLTLRFTRTFRNSTPSIFHWADNISITGGTTPTCYANCDGSTGSPLLTGNDFVCFINAYANSDSYANCDQSTGTPALTGNDFVCFINAYATGCT